MITMGKDASDRFEREKNRLYRPGRIRETLAAGHDKSWAVAYYIIGETQDHLLCNFYKGSAKVTDKIHKELIL